MKSKDQIGFTPSNKTSQKIQYQIKDLQVEFDLFFNFVTKSIIYLRRELEPILWCFTMYLISNAHKYFNCDSMLSKLKQNLLSESIKQEIQYFEHFCSKEYSLEEKINQYFKNIYSPSNQVVYLSAFANECLYKFLQSENCSFFILKLPKFLTIKIAEDNVAEANFKYTRTKLPCNFKDFSEINEKNFNPLTQQEDLEFLKALELRSHKLRGTSEPNFFQEDQTKYPEKYSISMPDMKLKNKIEFAKYFVEKRTFLYEQEPSVLQISFLDPQDKVTCVEIQSAGNVLLLGTMERKIICYLINPKFLESFEKKDHTIGKEIFLSAFDKNDKEKVEKDEKILPKTFNFKGHEGPITSLSLLYDELYFLSSSTDTTIRLWCIRQKSCLVVYKGQINTVWSVSFYSKGYFFASGASDNIVRLWSTDKISPLRIMAGHFSDVTIVRFLYNINYLASGSLDGSLRIWDINTGQTVRILIHTNNENITELSFSKTGRFMTTVSQQGSLVFWDLPKCKKIKTVSNKNKMIR